MHQRCLCTLVWAAMDQIECPMKIGGVKSVPQCSTWWYSTRRSMQYLSALSVKASSSINHGCIQDAYAKFCGVATTAASTFSQACYEQHLG